MLFPVYKDMSEAVAKHPEADILINFASLRSAFDATMEAMSFDQVRESTFNQITISIL